MKKNKNKISIFKRIGLIVMSFAIAIGSFFVGVQKNGHNQSLIASADYSYENITFSGSNIYVPTKRLISDSFDTSNLVDNLLFAVTFSQDINGYFSFDFSRTFGFGVQNQYNYDGDTFNYNVIHSFFLDTSSSSTDADYNPIYTNTVNLVENDLVRHMHYKINNTWVHSIILISYDHTVTDIIGVELSSAYIDNTSIGSSGTNTFLPKYYGYYNIISYFDEYNTRITFKFPCANLPDVLFTSRTYYFSNALDISDSEIYEQGYNSGFSQGLIDNQQNIYDKGYNAGKITGESIGFDKGLLEANDYSFKSLFGAVIDAPIKAFSALFNFEILGINLLDFFLGLLTFGVVIFVIKLLLGGK